MAHLGNTVKWLFIHCIFHVTLGTLLAFILYKKPRGWKFVRVTYMIPNIISQSAIAMIFLNLYNAQYGAVNSRSQVGRAGKLTAQLVIRHGHRVPGRHDDLVPLRWLHHHIGVGPVLSTDESIIEAAKIDGATSFQIDRLVMFPWSRT